MGNDLHSMKDYQIGQPYISNSESALTVSIAPASKDGKRYTTFSYPKNKGKIDQAAEKHIEMVRTTRHPYILKYLNTFEEGKNVILVTEHVVPLDVAIENQENVEIFAGIRDILEALIFLHEKSFVCHNGISVSSIFVTDNGAWKLSALENSTKILRLSKQSSEYDLSGFAEFALSVLEYLKEDSSMTVKFMQRLEQLTGENKEITDSLRSLLKDPFFSFPFLEIRDGIQNLPLKDINEKAVFFRTLHENLYTLPSLVICKRFLSSLFSPIVITDLVADLSFLKYLFASGNHYCEVNNVRAIVDEEHFKKHSLPLILTLYQSRDIAVRMIIMKYLPYYVDSISPDTLKEDVLPELLTGLKDNNDSLVTATFHALAVVVPILGSAAVVGGERMTCFFDRKPDFTRISEKRFTGINTSKTVSDIMQSQPVSSHNYLSSRTGEMVEEKQQKRLDREKHREEQRRKREEQRQKREQRKQERDSLKFQRLQTQSSDENFDSQEPTVSNESILPTVENTAEEHDNGNFSEPDWEGFEAFSNGSESEAKESAERILSSFVVEDDVDEWGWNDKHSLPDNNVEMNWKDDTSNSGDNHLNSSRDTLEQTQLKLTPSKALNLTNSPKIKPSEKLKKEDDSKKNIQTTTKDFSDFDIKIDTNKVFEPDYFADMIPTISKESCKTVVVENTQNNVSSKFSAINVSTQEPTGWGEDDGWDDEDF